MNDKMKVACDVIRQTASALEVGRSLGLDPGHDGRCRCFFHGGDNRNLKLYGKGGGYYCFVCHASGDVIRLVKEYTNSSFTDAVELLNDMCGLHMDLYGNSPRDRIKRAEARAKGYQMGNSQRVTELYAQIRQMKQQAEEEKLQEQHAFAVWETAERLVQTLKDIRDATVPTKPDEDWNPSFRAAIAMIPDAERNAREAWLDYAGRG